MQKKLPIGIQTFRDIVKENYIYIDKTEQALKLIDNYKYIFLSRPRRFGKSLFVDTLHEIFNGNKELFKGLYIYDKYDFETYPVIRIDWSGNFKTSESTELTAVEIFEENQKRLDIQCKNPNVAMCFRELIQKAYEKYGKKVVILIDEYDKPILDNLDNIEEAQKRRDFLRGLYVQMKANDAYIRFVFLTGISKFSKANIFSGLNNIEDISLNSDFATICGYTQADVEEKFAEELARTDREKVKEWYNGYNFLGEPVYNPFDILQFVRNNLIFRNYWWKSGNPFGIIELLKQGDYYIPELENLLLDEVLLDSFDIENIRLESLLFQAGYLTIARMYQTVRGVQYKLKVPNLEVQISLNDLFALYLTGKVTIDIQNSLYEALSKADFSLFENTLKKLFSSIPYNNYVKNNISHFEGYYASVIYAYLASSGVKMVAEDVSNRGRIDLTLWVDDKIYILEFKVGGEDALQQIKKKKYYEKYRQESKQIYLIGINFDEEERNIKTLQWEKLL